LALTHPDVPVGYARALKSYRYGPGVAKVDFALDGPVPWTNPEVAQAPTVHLGGNRAEIWASENAVTAGRVSENPYVLAVQPSVLDDSRAPAGKAVLWAYIHVPAGSTLDPTELITAQVERFAPGFRDRIIGRHTMNTAAMETHDANYIGGDIGGGVADLRQFMMRPTVGLHPWKTPVDGLYLCSSSTPPGGGVHGMCGWHAANEVINATR
jgi:phytoene dehydrogenase-like protein